jgi:hypothetical protein
MEIRRKGVSIVELVIVAITLGAGIVIGGLILSGTYYLLRVPVSQYKERNSSLYFVEGHPADVELRELITSYDIDSDNANSRFAGRHIRVSGIFREVRKHDKEYFFIIGDGEEWTDRALRCMAHEDDLPILAQLTRGEKLIVSGILQGADRFTGVVLHKPYIVLVENETEKETVKH